jgi:hypothetical protein
MDRFTSALFCLLISTAPAPARDILTAQYDPERTSWNSSETRLTATNVTPTTFGKLFSLPVDGWIYAQPLYLQRLTIPGRGTHSVVFVCTAANTVYAFDADKPTAPYWSRNLGPADTTKNSRTSPNSEPVLGIISSPVIVPEQSALYVVAATRENGHRVYRLHALDLATGREKFHGPLVITGQTPGTASDAENGVLTFNADFHLQRTSLALADGSIYFAMAGSHDIDPFHGWIFGYSASTLEQTAVLNLSSSGMEVGVWQSMRAPAVDARGNLYFETGNGDYDGIYSFGNSVVRLATSSHLFVADWFTPDNWQTLRDQDNDLSSAGPLLIPGTNTLIAAGKTGAIYVLDTTRLGKFQSGNPQAIQILQATPPCAPGGVTCDYTNDPVFWNHSTRPMLYIWAWMDVLRSFTWSDNRLAPSATGGAASNYPGGYLAGSSNGGRAGTGILWALTGDKQRIAAATLHAFDATDVSREIWNSDMNPQRDAPGDFAKNVPPLVANGKVYVATFSSELAVYGLK